MLAPWEATKAQKEKARSRVSYLMKRGRLTRPGGCAACGEPQGVYRPGGRAVWTVQWHHPDYSRPLDLIPLCVSCHRLVHWGSLREPITGRLYPIPRVLPVDDVIDELAAGPGSLIELAARLACPAHRVSKVVRGLYAAGRVSRVRRPHKRPKRGAFYVYSLVGAA